MRRNFEGLRQRVAAQAMSRDPRFWVRAGLGALLLLNLAAFWMVVSPPGGSVEQLEAELIAKRSELAQRKAALERSKQNLARVEISREQDRKFQEQFFTDRRVASSTFVAELSKAATESGLKPREHTFLFDPVEGSDTLSMMTITAAYEGSYADLLKAMNKLDRSSRFLILDSLTASPQQTAGMLNVTVKLNAFVKETAAQP
jgi:type IV pilus assembly protein PilO